MSDANGQAAPGWYPDPVTGTGRRWWDGVQWTGQTAPALTPYPPAYASTPERRPLAPGTSVSTVWIWLVVLLPLVSLFGLLFIHPHIDVAALESGTAVPDPIGMMGGPAYFVEGAVSWILYALLVVFSWLDWRELGRRGVERPFHWAWSFLASIVYVIGRTVILRKVADRGAPGVWSPLWAMIAVTVIGWIVGIIWTIMFLSSFMNGLGDQAFSALG